MTLLRDNKTHMRLIDDSIRNAQARLEDTREFVLTRKLTSADGERQNALQYAKLAQDQVEVLIDFLAVCDQEKFQ